MSLIYIMTCEASRGGFVRHRLCVSGCLWGGCLDISTYTQYLEFLCVLSELDLCCIKY